MTATRLVLLCMAWTAAGWAHLGLVENDQRLVRVCQRAIDFAKKGGQCEQSVRLLNITGCNGKGAMSADLLASLDLHFKNGADMIIMGNCDQPTLDMSRLSAGFDFALFNRNFGEPSYANENDFPNLIYMPDTVVMFMAQSLVALLQKIGQTDFVLIGPTARGGSTPVLTDVLVEMLDTLKAVNLSHVIRIDENNWDNIYKTVEAVRTRIRTIVIDGSFTKLSTILSTMNVIELGSNGYLIILLCRDSYTVCSKEMLTGYENSKLLVIAPHFTNYETQTKLLSEWIPDIDFTDTYFSEMVALYDMCYTYCYCSSKSQARTSSEVFGAIKGQTLPGGEMGPVAFDTNSNYVREVVLLQFQDNNNFSLISTARAVPSECTRFTCSAVSFDPLNFKLWPDELAREIPVCFYSGGCTNYTPLMIGAGVALLAAVILGLAYLYQRRKRLDVFRMHWKVAKADLKVIENKQSKAKAVPGSEDTGKASTLVSKRRIIVAYALIGTAKSEFMLLKQLKKIKWTKQEMSAITELKRINHDNMTTFLGICYNEGDKFYVLHSLVERASLENFIDDDDFVMDTTFKSAFLRDIINGLQYLHKSTVGFHGLLNPANCLIDGNWVLKLTNFGLVNVLNAAIEREQIKLTEIIPYTTYYSTAPENLEDVAYGRMFPKGSRLGDIYSFGTLLYSVLFRKVPYGNVAKPAKDIVEDIRKNGIVPKVEDTEIPEEKPLIDLMQLCWKKNPEDRPKMKKLNQVVQGVFESSKGNLIDQMIKMNYTYAQHLEKIVNERTAEFESQKQMNARLLQQILPASIAERLMSGETIVPRNYELATVLFCQLVDFNYFLSHTAPHNVIRFLNDVFTRFDAVIERHDAYKVETTGETYMVASGVPNENDNRHVIEISEIALELRALCNHYKVEHIENWKVQVRIGYHCGPIAAGVVGARAPRFCLFGDTVNFASRMQSNCPPNQIQMSEPTAERLQHIPRYKLTKRGIVRVKGKGDVNTYWLDVDVEPDLGPHRSLGSTPQVPAIPLAPSPVPQFRPRTGEQNPEQTQVQEPEQNSADEVKKSADVVARSGSLDKENRNELTKSSEENEDEKSTARIDDQVKDGPEKWIEPPIVNGQTV